MAKLVGKERAVILAQLAVQIEAGRLGQEQAARTAEHALVDAEEILTAAENLVAKKYGEYR